VLFPARGVRAAAPREAGVGVLDLSRLSAEQRQIVLAGDGPLLVVAGPGSGKTTVLAAYIAQLVGARHVPPASVLAVTFTTAAARELRDRLGAILGDSGRSVDVTTLHAFGLRIIRQWSAALGLGAGRVAVYGAGDARGVLREAVATAGLDSEGGDLRALERAVERYRLTLGHGGDPSPGGGPASTASPWAAAETVAAVAGAYEALLQRRCAVDYAAMLVLPLRLFETHPAALRLYQDAYRVVLCDECQDVCAAQYALLRLLAARHRNLVLVGDPRQSLYGWRGADGRLLATFGADFPEARVYSLDENFRSAGRLVELANALSSRLGHARPLWTRNPPGDAARLYVADDDRTEAAFVAAEVEHLLRSGAIARPGEVAILYRTNRQGQELALALRGRGLPYRVRGSGDLFARREVQDALAYLRLAHNPEDVAALARIANVPPRRLGRLADRLAQELRERPVPLAELPLLARDFGPAATAGAEALVQLIRDLHEQSARLPNDAMLELALAVSGYRAWIGDQSGGAERLVHLEQLAALAARSEADLGSWLAELQLGTCLGEGADVEADAGEPVLLTTIHAAKGGEWPVVFLVGAEEGLLPHSGALQTGAGRPSAGMAGPEGGTSGTGGGPMGRPERLEGVEEERRVAFVAVTRPRDRLYVTYCRARHQGDRIEPRRPSRFLEEVPPALLERAAPASLTTLAALAGSGYLAGEGRRAA
jgi:DNA helicase II / ATP-dependent DNA helicase PcrA